MKVWDSAQARAKLQCAVRQQTPTDLPPGALRTECRLWGCQGCLPQLPTAPPAWPGTQPAWQHVDHPGWLHTQCTAAAAAVNAAVTSLQRKLLSVNSHAQAVLRTACIRQANRSEAHHAEQPSCMSKQSQARIPCQRMCVAACQLAKQQNEASAVISKTIHPLTLLCAWRLLHHSSIAGVPLTFFRH